NSCQRNDSRSGTGRTRTTQAGGLPTMNSDASDGVNPPDFADQAPTRKLRITRRHVIAVFGAGAVALGLPARLAAEPARAGLALAGMPLLKQDAVCIMSAEVTQGPYYISGQLVRKDITEGKQGFPLNITMSVSDYTNGCNIPRQRGRRRRAPHPERH